MAGSPSCGRFAISLQPLALSAAVLWLLFTACPIASAQSAERFSLETTASIDHFTNDSTATRPVVSTRIPLRIAPHSLSLATVFIRLSIQKISA